MLPDDLEYLKILRKRIDIESNELAIAAATGVPLKNLGDSSDASVAMIEYARLVGGITAYHHIMEMITTTIETRDKALQGDDNDKDKKD